MLRPERNINSVRPQSDQAECLKQLKAAGAKPWQMTLYGVLNFALPAMWKASMTAIALTFVSGAWK